VLLLAIGVFANTVALLQAMLRTELSGTVRPSEAEKAAANNCW
jgi:hypothetical protein